MVTRDVNCNVFACFIDFEKVFDRVNHIKLIETLQNSSLDDKNLRIISNLYWQQQQLLVFNIGHQRKSESLRVFENDM